MIRKNPNKIKKTPIKGEPAPKVKVEKLEKVEKPTIKEDKPISCSICNKVRPIAIKSKKICALCNKKMQLEKNKLKRKVKREKKAETITQAKLDQITSWLIRSAFEEKCYACGTVMSKKQLQCCHFVSRTKTITRFDLRNMLPGCPKCNMYTPHHVWNLGKSINNIWGENTTETLLDTVGITLKMNNNDRKEIFTIYKNAFEEIESKNMSFAERYLTIVNCYYQYCEIIHKIIKL
jgi:hypothetical protein